MTHSITIASPQHGQEAVRTLWAWMRRRLMQGRRVTLSVALKRQKVVPGIDGGFVVLGSSTSRMTVAEMTEMIDFIHSFGVQQGVEFSDVSSEKG